MPGYTVGPTLEPGMQPWPTGWEQDPRIDDGHQHRWETLLLTGHRIEEVVRCGICSAPRCGHSTDPDPCMKRRHHRDCHRYLSGRTEHLSGIASTCRCGGWKPLDSGSRKRPSEPDDNGRTGGAA